MHSNRYFAFLRPSIAFITVTIFTVNAQKNRPEVETIVASTVATIVGAESEQCTAADCNERGTCFGTKAMPFCLCQIGFAGLRCQEAYCDSARDCSGRGWCMGTASQNTCLCTIGFSGAHCENEVTMIPPALTSPLKTTVTVEKQSTSEVTAEHQPHREAESEVKKGSKNNEVLEEHSAADDVETPESDQTHNREHEKEQKRDIRQHPRDIHVNNVVQNLP